MLDGITTSSSKHAETPADRLQMGFILHGLLTGDAQPEEDDEVPTSPGRTVAQVAKEPLEAVGDKEPEQEAEAKQADGEAHKESGPSPPGPDIKLEVTEVTETSAEL